jgi:SEC-C motif
LIKVSRNDFCPCLSGKKYKRCCLGVVDWEHIFRNHLDLQPHMSVRGRNIQFADAIADALQIDPSKQISLAQYKRAFTPEAVRKIYEAVMYIWPPHTDIQRILEKSRADVSGLYLGDYNIDYLRRALVRHSIYANKILLVEPFQHPYILNPKFNPIENPSQYRAQTLKDVNFYYSMMPWVEAGIVEFIRTPADFDRRLNFDALTRAQILRNDPIIQAAVEETVEDLGHRHYERQARQLTVLAAPDSYLRRMFRDMAKERPPSDFTEDDFISYIHSVRAQDPDFLEPIGPKTGGQLHVQFSGGLFEMAASAAQMTGSYLFTDLKAKWAQIEQQRGTTGDTQVWSPFAKALQNTKLHYLDNLELHHALQLRAEGRLENLRSFMTKMWAKARGDQPFSERAAVDLANEFTDAVGEAEAEWAQLQIDLVKRASQGAAAALVAFGPAVATGAALWHAAATAVGAVGVAFWSKYRRRQYDLKFPAAFFMDLKDSD